MYKIRFFLAFACLSGVNFLFSQGQTNIIVNADGTYNTCNGFIIDSGGQGGPGYSIDEDYTITICPDNPDDIVNITFNLFNLDNFDDNPLPGPNQVNVDQMFVYDGNSTGANFLGNYTGNGLQGVLIQCSPQNTSGCLTFRFVSNTVNNPGTWAFSGSAQCITPCDDPVAAAGVVGGITSDSIHACIGELLNFQDMGSFAQPGFSLASYSWDFMDGTVTSGANASHTYAIPGHYRVQLFVTDDNGCSNNNLIDIDVLIATPPNFVNFQPDTTMCLGEFLNIVADPLSYENTWNGFSGSTTIENGCLPDTLLGIAQNIDVIQTGFQGGSTISNGAQIESLCLELEHSYMGDIVVMVTCPNGQNVILHQQGGGGTQIGEPNGADNIDCSDPSTLGETYNYCFTPQATQTWVEYADQFGGTLPAGDYEPVQPLSNLVGCPTNGVWTLTVVDNWAADDGHVVSFAIHLDTSLYADIVEFTPQHGTSLDSSYWTFPAPFASNLSSNGESMTITPTAIGTYTYTYNIENSFGCHNDTSFTIDVFDFTMPINIEDTVICTGSINLVQNLSSNCTYTLRLVDSFGDGWNGNSIHLTQGGVTTLYDIDDPQGQEDNYVINVTHGETLTFFFDGVGSFLEECFYQLIDGQGNIVFEDGGNFTAPSTSNHSVVVSCMFGYEFVWSPANVFDDPTAPNPLGTFNSAQNVSVSVYPIGHPACGSTDNALVSIATEPIHGVDSTIIICSNLLAPLNLFTSIDPLIPQNGTWTNPVGTVLTMPILSQTLPVGVYTYDYPMNNCFGHDVVKLNVTHEQSIFPLLAVLDPDICIGDSSYFTNITESDNVFASMVYFGDGDSLLTSELDPFNHYYQNVGIYELKITTVSNLGCIYNNIFPALEVVHALPTANFGTSPSVLTTMAPQADLIDMSSNDVINYSWFMPGSSPDTANTQLASVNYPILIPGDYSVSLTVSNFYGCKDSITKIVRVEDVASIYIPNSFTPNGDELNNTLIIVTNGIELQEFKFTIYDRWGEVIFVTFDVNNGWDGTFGSQLVQAGVYQWTLEAVDALTNIPILRNGFINVFI